MREIDIAWAAGIFEGEGSVGPRMATVTQKDDWLLYRLESIFGGKVGNKRKKDGTMQWWICGQAGRDFVKTIYKYLSPRRQVQLDSTFLNDEKLAENQRQHRERCRQKMLLRPRKRNNLGRFTNA